MSLNQTIYPFFYISLNQTIYPLFVSIYLSIGINVRFAAMMADVGDGLLRHIGGHSRT